MPGGTGKTLLDSQKKGPDKRPNKVQNGEQTTPTAVQQTTLRALASTSAKRQTTENTAQEPTHAAKANQKRETQATPAATGALTTGCCTQTESEVDMTAYYS